MIQILIKQSLATLASRDIIMELATEFLTLFDQINATEVETTETETE
jgi:hypothetical protein